MCQVRPLAGCHGSPDLIAGATADGTFSEGYDDAAPPHPKLRFPRKEVKELKEGNKDTTSYKDAFFFVSFF
jgi:hypothetical protein